MSIDVKIQRTVFIVIIILSAWWVVFAIVAGPQRDLPTQESPAQAERDGRLPVAELGPKVETRGRGPSEVARVDGTISEQALQAELQKVRRQVGAEFRTAIVKPFVVAGDLSAAEFEKICAQTIRWAVEMLRKDFFSDDPEAVITIYLFADKESYRKHALSLFGDRPDTPYGYYSREHRVLVMNIATGTGTLVHEIVHPFLEADFRLAPSWLNEGLASLFEQCRQREGRIVGLLNWRLGVLKKGLLAGNLVPLEKLLATSTEDFYEDPHGMHYAQARYLCYYLQEQRLLRKFYREFKKNQKVDPTGRITLLKVTGKSSLEELQDEWLEFLAPLNYGR